MSKAVLLYISLLLPVLTTSIAHGVFEPPKNPNSAKACAICHYRWIDIFFEGNVTTSFLRSTDAIMLCNECHGLDALFRFKYYHKVDERIGEKDMVILERR